MSKSTQNLYAYSRQKIKNLTFFIGLKTSCGVSIETYKNIFTKIDLEGEDTTIVKYDDLIKNPILETKKLLKQI